MAFLAIKDLASRAHSFRRGAPSPVMGIDGTTRIIRGAMRLPNLSALSIISFMCALNQSDAAQPCALNYDDGLLKAEIIPRGQNLYNGKKMISYYGHVDFVRDFNLIDPRILNLGSYTVVLFFPYEGKFILDEPEFIVKIDNCSRKVLESYDATDPRYRGNNTKKPDKEREYAPFEVD